MIEVVVSELTEIVGSCFPQFWHQKGTRGGGFAVWQALSLSDILFILTIFLRLFFSDLSTESDESYSTNFISTQLTLQILEAVNSAFFHIDLRNRLTCVILIHTFMTIFLAVAQDDDISILDPAYKALIVRAYSRH